MYTCANKSKPLLMRLLVIALVFSIYGMNATTTELNSKSEKEKTEKKEKEVGENENSVAKNFHSVRKWKITVEYTNGDMLSKTISIDKNSSLSTMDIAFSEAEKYVTSLKEVKDYNVSPISDNSFILLARN